MENTFIENTIIRKKDGTSIDSKDCHSFHINVRMVKKSVNRDSGENPSSRTYPSRIELAAHTFENKIEVISSFHSIDDACNTLLSLLEAIGKEKMWDATEHNSGQGSDNESDNQSVFPGSSTNVPPLP